MVRFINARSEDDLIEFFKRFGLPVRGIETSVELEIDQQADLTTILEKAASKLGLAGPAVAHLVKGNLLRPDFNSSGSGQSARLVLRTESSSGSS